MSVAALLAFIAVVAPSAPPPAPVITTVAQAPMIIEAPPAARPAVRVTETIAVQFRQDGRLLWSGEMMRASDGTASFSQQLRESRACPYADPQQPRWANSGARNTSLSVAINPDYPSTDGAVRIIIERTRPYGRDGEECGGQGNSTVRFDTRAILPSGKAVTLEGEGGLSVTLTRR